MDNDQYKMGRLPILPISWADRELALPKEIMIDYKTDEQTGHEPTYDIYLVDPNNRKNYINLSERIRTMAPIADADNFNITIEGLKDSQKLKDILNKIYSRFIFPDTETEDYDGIMGKIFNTDDNNIPINSLLTDIQNNTILPITIANNVFDSNGVSIETKLNSITRVGFSSTFIKVEETGSDFDFEFPFENYIDGANYVEVRIGGTIINKARYYITPEEIGSDGVRPVDAKITFYEKIEKGRTINLLFIYNAASDGSTYHIMSGSNIASGSAPITIMEKVSDSFNLPDPTSVATSKGLYNLYSQFVSVVNNFSPYCIYLSNYSSNSSNISVTIPSTFTLRDGVVLNINIGDTPTNPSCKLHVMQNGITVKYDIYNGSSKLNKSLPANKIIRFHYSSSDNCFYIKSLQDYRISCNRWYVVTDDDETTISYNGLEYDVNSEIFVYRNGVRLFEGLDYNMNNDETITLHVGTESEETIVFETHDIIES